MKNIKRLIMSITGIVMLLGIVFALYIQFVLHQPLLQSIKRDIDSIWTLEEKLPLMIAIEQNKTKEALKLINLSNDPYSFQNGDYRHDYPIIVASKNCNQKIVEALLKKGANVDSYCFGNTPLIAAVKKGCFDVAKTLVMNGADVNLRDDINFPLKGNSLFVGYTPLGYASKSGYYKIAKSLIEHGAKLNDIQYKYYADKIYKYTPLVLALKNKKYKVAELLIEKGADVTLFNPILYSTGSKNIVNILLTKGAKINVVGENNDTVLFRAIKDNPDIIPYLLTLGADEVANIQDSRGRTALILAAGGNYYSRESTLSKAYKALRRYTDTDLKDEHNCTARAYLIVGEHGSDGYDINLIRQEFYNYDGFWGTYYLVEESLKEVKECVIGLGGIGINYFDTDDYISLEITKILMESKILSADDDTLGNKSLLHLATQSLKPHPKTIEYLVKNKKMSIDISDSIGSTPLMYACNHENKAKLIDVKTLIELGANINKKNNYGDTALDYAINNDNFPVVKLLIEKGANIDQSTLKFAIKKGNRKIIKLLKEKASERNAI